ncbi:MAG: hypothetical protein PVG20_06870 [Thioalkalispiraceae bacterium]|jgi:hypothetical protein
MNSDTTNDLPDARDGLSHKQRIILYCLEQLLKERGDRNVPTAMLYGRVIEHLDMSIKEFQAAITVLNIKNLF